MSAEAEAMAALAEKLGEIAGVVLLRREVDDLRKRVAELERGSQYQGSELRRVIRETGRVYTRHGEARQPCAPTPASVLTDYEW